MSAKREVAAVTSSRADFGLLEPLLDRIRRDERLKLRLMVTGGHFDPAYGPTVKEIDALGYEYERGLEMPLDSDTPGAIAKSLGAGVQAFARAFSARRPDIVVVTGDRIEMLCPAFAAAPFNLPMAHLYGGKITEGAIDELSRHVLTKLTHLHFVSSKRHAQRVMQMGEEPWRVFNVGSPGLDRIHKFPRRSREDVCREVGLREDRPFLLVTFHPVTLEPGQRPAQIGALLAALERTAAQLVMTYPNADAGSSEIIAALERYAQQHSDTVRLLKNAGARLYFDLLACATAMVGNSSSGIAEAPTFELPAVNIGTRQAGFDRAANVIDVGYGADEIVAGIERAMTAEFKASLQGLRNPYGEGRSSDAIVEQLRSIPLDDRLLRKKFVDWTPAP